MERRPATDRTPELELVRSTRRTRSASASLRDGRIVVQLPAGLAPLDEERIVASLVAKVTDRLRSQELPEDDLYARACQLADRYVDGVRPASVTWSSRMARRWASCSIHSRTIRVSRRLAGAPRYVLDDVLVHELAHLLEPDHGPAFHAIVARHPDHDRARAFLDGVQFAEARAVVPDLVEPGDASA